jgi:hypothetical protein
MGNEWEKEPGIIRSLPTNLKIYPEKIAEIRTARAKHELIIGQAADLTRQEGYKKVFLRQADGRKD